MELERIGKKVESAALCPSFEEGRQRRSSEYNDTLNSALPGRSNHCCYKILTSPAAPCSKVARRL